VREQWRLRSPEEATRQWSKIWRIQAYVAIPIGADDTKTSTTLRSLEEYACDAALNIAARQAQVRMFHPKRTSAWTAAGAELKTWE